MQQTWIQEWGPYLIGLGGILVALVGTRAAGDQARKARSFEARLERARFMRASLAEAQLASAEAADGIIPIVIALGQVDDDQLHEIIDPVKAASMRLRELAAMMSDASTVDLIMQVVERLHGQMITIANAANLARVGALTPERADNAKVHIETLRDGDGTADGLQKLSMMELWEQLRQACSDEFEALTRDR